jgi:uncharacterized protein
MLFGPDGRLYKCVYDLGVHPLSHGRLTGSAASNPTKGPFRIFADTSGGSTDLPSAPHDYMNYDPCSNPSCSKCEYLPICMGGCPKTQLEGDNGYTDRFKRYWDANLDAMLRTYADIILSDHSTPLQSLQTPFGPEAMNTRRELEASGII